MKRLLLIILLLALVCVLAYCVPMVGAAVLGLQKYGGGQSKSEAAVIDKLERLTGLDFPTAHPKWLHGMELDGYNADAKIALEFSGPLHTKWYPAKETYESYLRRVKRDRQKKELCKQHGVYLIVLDMRLPQKHHVAYLRSRLYDAGFFDVKHPDYIDEQIHKPYLRRPEDLPDE